ncbi:hypothetical protein [Pantoea sp. RHCKP32]|uniref:hypothetical protein n=1 Tax=Pantoea sp. RHCKP32 TaxID=3425182 RepID=UPI003DA0A4C4
MSWNAGEWLNFGVAASSAIASISAMIAAFMSKNVARKALFLQKKTSESERKRALREALKLNARKANDSVGNLWPKDWDYRQISAIANATVSAKQDILAEIEILPENEIAYYKSIYLTNLSENIYWELQSQSTPKSIYLGIEGNIMPLVVLQSRWTEGRDFFHTAES